MKQKIFAIALLTPLFLGLSAQQNKVVLNFDSIKYTISPNLYGHFSEHLGKCIYEGIYVGDTSNIKNIRGIRTDVVDALKETGIPNLRWPGGCFAEEYHWKDGVGPKENRPSIINTNWGGVTENNSFGTHEFLDLCKQLNCEPIICGNVGSGTVQELSQWVEYINSSNESPMTSWRQQNGQKEPWKVKYWGIGNESWGCGGNMRPEYYFDNARQYSSYMKNYDGTQLYKILVGPGGEDYNWTETIMKEYAKLPEWTRSNLFKAISLHYYTLMGDWTNKGSATDFTTNEYAVTIKKTLLMEDIINKNLLILDKYDTAKTLDLVIDEWGCWHDVEPGSNPGFLFQQNTLRDALVAAANFNIFNNHCDRVKMANIAQVVNVLQSVVLTHGESIVKTPTFYVFKMYKVHQGATLIPSKVTCGNYVSENNVIPVLSNSASLDKENKIHITLANLDPVESKSVEYELIGRENFKFTAGQIISAGKLNAYNDFGKVPDVQSVKFESVKVAGNKLIVNIPAKSIVMIELE
jgi:alpha-L-arabinofuranosidase